MTNLTVAKSYLEKADKRQKILQVLLAEEAYSDVIREAQVNRRISAEGNAQMDWNRSSQMA